MYDIEPITYNKKGFTIIELVISIFILSIAIVGVYSAFSMMVVLTASASDRLTATYLVQEGVEIIRNIRDSNWTRSSTNWLDGLDACLVSAGGCRLDYKTMGTVDSPVYFYGTEGEYLNIEDVNNFYGYGIGTPTKFKRKVLIKYLSDYTDYIVKVTVTVYWDEKPGLLNPTGVAGSITAEVYFYNWYNYNNPF